MKVFISWSGDHSHAVARALHRWLPLVIHEAEPFMSSGDIYAGTRWQAEVAAELEATDFAIVCVTRANQRSPWLNFEAGAVARVVASGRVVPLAVDLSEGDIELPLSQFQSKPMTRNGIAAIVASVNSVAGRPLSASRLSMTFDKWWPELQTELSEINIPEPSVGDNPKEVSSPVGRGSDEVLGEILALVRGIVREPPTPRPPTPEPPTRELTYTDLSVDELGVEVSTILRRHKIGGAWRMRIVSDRALRVELPEDYPAALVAELEDLDGIIVRRIEEGGIELRLRKRPAQDR